MSFTIEQTAVQEYTSIQLQNDDQFRVSIIPEIGAMLHGMEIKLNGEDFNVVDNYGSTGISTESVGTSFKGVKLSPWPCRIARAKYKFDETEFSLSRKFKDGTALHGLLFDQPFTVLDQFASEETAFVILRHVYEGSDAGYPYTYECEVKYAIHPGRLLEVETTIRNLSDNEIPIADGWHPYFQLGGKVNDWELNFPAVSMVEFDERLIPTGLLVPYKAFNETRKIGNVNLDNCFFLKIHEFKPICTLRNPANNISIHFYTNPAYSYLQIFIPPHRNSIAIENLSSAPDAFNNHMGLIRLQPENSRTFRVFYQVEVEENV